MSEAQPQLSGREMSGGRGRRRRQRRRGEGQDIYSSSNSSKLVYYYYIGIAPVLQTTLGNTFNLWFFGRSLIILKSAVMKTINSEYLVASFTGSQLY